MGIAVVEPAGGTIGGKPVSTNAPTDGQLLEFSQGANEWQPQTGAYASLESAGTTALIGAPLSAKAASTTNIASLSGTPVVDGYQTVAGDVVLLTGQTTGSQNGPWTVAAGAWTRPSGFASGQQIINSGPLVDVTGGTANSGIWWMDWASGDAVIVDTTATTWSTLADSTWKQLILASSVPAVTYWNLPAPGESNKTNVGALNIVVANANLGVVIHQPSHLPHAFCIVNDGTGFRATLDWYTNSSGREEFSISNNGDGDLSLATQDRDRLVVDHCGTVTLNTPTNDGTAQAVTTLNVHGQNGSNPLAQWFNDAFSGTVPGLQLVVDASGNVQFGTPGSAGSILFYVRNTTTLNLTAAKSVVLGPGTLTTASTDGFPYLPSAAGAPTGVATAQSGHVPFYYDTTNHKIWVYDGGWTGVGVA